MLRSRKIFEILSPSVETIAQRLPAAAIVAVFSEIHDAIKAKWSGHKTLLGFCPDHGCHEIDGGVGSHGLDMQEDMNIIHMFSFIK